MNETPRILVVDDEATIRTAIELMLEEREWLVVAAANEASSASRGPAFPSLAEALD